MSVILLVISVAVSGWAFLTAYPRFLMTLSSLPAASIHPAGMANIRGLVSVLGSYEMRALVFVLSGSGRFGWSGMRGEISRAVIQGSSMLRIWRFGNSFWRPSSLAII